MFLRLMLVVSSVFVANASLFAKSAITPVMRHNMGAYVWEDLDWPNEPFRDYLNRCMEYQGNMQPFQKCRAAWSILDRHYEKMQKGSQKVLGNDWLTWQNLQLLRGEKEDERLTYVANIVDRSSTEMGKVTMRAWIAQPTDDHELLLKRQSCARFFVEQEELFNELEKHFAVFKKSENFLLSFWINDPLKRTAERNYFSMSSYQAAEDFFNESTAALLAGTVVANSVRALGCWAAIAATAVLPAHVFTKLILKKENNDLERRADRFISAGSPAFGWLAEIIEKYKIDNNYVRGGLCVTAAGYAALTAKDQCEWARDNIVIMQCLQTKLYHVAQCLKSLEAIGSLLHKHPELRDTVGKDMATLMNEFKAAESSTHALYTLLQSTTFETEGAMFAHWGRILVAFRLMHQQTNSIEPLLCALGEVDAYMSIARLYKEFEHSRVRYTFADYVTESEHPMIAIQDLWSPFIDPSYVVTNSINLGGSAAQNLVITGPNEGGKSTFVKGVAIGIILAQSIGIVPASHATITPFSYISTYLNITDDHGKSLFEAQVQRAKQILDHIDGMKSNKHSFVIIDELFNGTDARVGQATSYSIADYLSRKSGVISIFPTHFPELTGLEQNGRSLNYKVTASINDDGSISYPFVIEPGASQQNIVLNIMHNEGFNTAIIDQAQRILGEIYKR